ncbi:LysR family transcriptional regulator [Halomonas organivorans]|uniref:DNA-binding transcriptional LysR family regulator n=1 Tax=Halomonas organivorans TaxID=257772 RepID=A0A7W5BXE0_9GAMM|nr:LysR family transcriptional regulator [Halomonas organivorans]MBB3140921.1 DNA-binding transcriptional LysR family regulator [Halomonas organivorans]
MDIKQLKFLIALEETRHFGKAAERCHVTQPTLSMRLRALEDELELTLVNRGQRFEGLTEAGERILAWARTLLAAHDGLQSEAANCRGQLVGTLRLGMVPLAALNPMRLIEPLSQAYPELRFELHSRSSERIIDDLNRNQLDIGLCYLEQADADDFDVIRLGTTDMGLLHDTRFFSFDRQRLEWTSLGDLPLGLLSKGMHYRHSIGMSFSRHGLDPAPVVESDSTFQLVQAVSAGICCAIMPLESGIDTLSEHLQIVPIADASTYAPMGLVMRRAEPRSALAEECFAKARLLFPATDALQP